VRVAWMDCAPVMVRTSGSPENAGRGEKIRKNPRKP
jgi:hypothetical protein